MKLPTLDELMALEKAATPGPWEAGEEKHALCTFREMHGGEPFNRFGGRKIVIGSTSFTKAGDCYHGACGLSEDFALIATTRNALPHLLAIAEAVHKMHWRENDSERLNAAIACENAYHAARAAGLFGEVGK